MRLRWSLCFIVAVMFGLCGCEIICLPDCSGKDCGDDGCGGSCGYCGVESECAVQGGNARCVDGHAYHCEHTECGWVHWGGCEPGGGCYDYFGFCHCTKADSVCVSGSGIILVEESESSDSGACVTVWDLCGEDGCSALVMMEVSDSCASGSGCSAESVCQEAERFGVPDCEGRECGDNGCGGSCGTCAPEMTCVERDDGASDCISGKIAACGKVECGGAWYQVCEDTCKNVSTWCPCPEDEICVARGTLSILPESIPVTGECVAISDFCGNGVCEDEELGETCGSCPEDCPCK